MTQAKLITFTAGEIVDLLIAMDLARDSAFVDIRETTAKRKLVDTKAVALSQLARWTELSKKLEAVIV